MLTGFALQAWPPHGALAVLGVAYLLFIPACLAGVRTARRAIA